MEEDTRSYSPSHPFRKYAEAVVASNSPMDDAKTVRSHPAPSTKQLNKRKRGDADPILESWAQVMARKKIPGGSADPANRAPMDNPNRSTLGMVALDDDSDGNGELPLLQRQQQQEDLSPQDENSSVREETQQLFRDYQRRFYRQSLTNQAKEILNKALKLARGTSANDFDTINPIRTSIDLCSEALELCDKAIRDQEDSLHRDTDIGGSYLVIGDIRLRKKGEALRAKICCLRAACFHKETKYEEALEDCEAAIAVWKQQYGEERRRCPSVRRFGMGRHNFSSSSKAKGNLPRTLQSGHGPKKLLSHKHLFLLKARVLACLGRYRDAVVWLTHPQELPAKVFLRSSPLLESDVATNRFLDQLLQLGRGQRRGMTRLERRNETMMKEPPSQNSSPTTTAAVAAAPVTIPTNTKLWSNLLHSVDQRLNEGTDQNSKFRAAAVAAATFRKSSNTNQQSVCHSASAIYQMLRHGPVFFHQYYHKEGETKSIAL